MFRSSTIIRELALNLAKFIFMLKHSVKLRRYLLCGCVAACHGIGMCVACCPFCTACNTHANFPSILSWPPSNKNDGKLIFVHFLLVSFVTTPYH